MDTWDNSIRRVVIHTADYLGFDGRGTAGGRQRFIRDIAALIRNKWKREVLIVQKSVKSFEKTCSAGFPVTGIRSILTAKGDPIFAYMVRRVMKPGDGLLYASGEDAWPFFTPGSKAIQHGVWWDGPQTRRTRWLQTRRAVSCMEVVRSMLCVDTNFINWLRGQGRLGLSLANKCVYIPNFADLERIGISSEIKTDTLKLLCARRYEEKRGIDVFVQALALLKKENFSFSAHVSAPLGRAKVEAMLAEYGLSDVVTVSEDNMDEVLERYRHADVAVVPTIWSEGTSLACVEALCAGLPVIATPVGGLGNLIIPGFNGYLVAPTAENIARSILLFKDKSMLASLRGNALSLRDSLGKEAWEGRVLAWLKT